MKKKKRIHTVVYHVLVSLFGFAMIYPLLWMVMSSFKESSTIFRDAHNLIPDSFHFENYINGWKGFGGYTFGVFFSNSFRITVISTIGAVISSAVIAFGFARLRFKGRGFWFACVMMTMMLPFQVVMIPQFLIFKKLNWINTILPLTVPYYFGQAFFIFQNMQFIRGIPMELDEAARIDGCSYYGIFARIILPLIKPSIVTTAIFSFMWRWDDFFGSLLYLNSPSKYTVSIALKMFSDPSAQSDWGAMFAMSTLSVLPIFLIFLFFQKYLVEGISTEGLKA
jgi:multiple sugar transport system permease protein